ncbi:MAG: hypothetical protein ACR2KT_12550 [Methylocella sp.]
MDENAALALKAKRDHLNVCGEIAETGRIVHAGARFGSERRTNQLRFVTAKS